MNIAKYLVEQAAERPEQRAVVVSERRHAEAPPRYRQWSFARLNEDSDRLARGFTAMGLGHGARVVTFVPPGVDFFSVTFALFKIGAAPVMIDPAMGRRRLLSCLRGAEPEALVAPPRLHWARLLYPRYFETVKHFVTLGRRRTRGGLTLDEIRRVGGVEPAGPMSRDAPDGHPVEWFPLTETRPDETAAILYTSGATGPPKGVVYEHGMFDAQIRWLRDAFGLRPGETELACFPLFALFTAGLGMTCVLPDMDFTRPAEVHPERVVEAARDHQCVSAFGSPALWDRVSRYCLERGVRLETLRRVLMAGAPARGEVVERTRRIIAPDGDCHTPYGATEALPVATISGYEIVTRSMAETARGAGVCVGRPVEGVEVRIVKITEKAIEHWDEHWRAAPGKIGEICVSGDVVTKEYFNRPDRTILAKIRDGDKVWHRMGDLGRFDDEGRLWMMGRKSQRVVSGETIYFTTRCESVFNRLPSVARSALVGVGPEGRRRPVMVIELKPDWRPPSGRIRRRYLRELRELALSNEHTRDIEDFLFHPGLPVDRRHNVKIDREALAKWAARTLGLREHGLEPSAAK